MSREENKSIESIKQTLEDEKYKLIAFIAISEDGCKQICTGAEDRGDLVKIVGELQLFICDIYDRINQGDKQAFLEAMLSQVVESTDKGEDDARVLN